MSVESVLESGTHLIVDVYSCFDFHSRCSLPVYHFHPYFLDGGSFIVWFIHQHLSCYHSINLKHLLQFDLYFIQLLFLPQACPRRRIPKRRRVVGGSSASSSPGSGAGSYPRSDDGKLNSEQYSITAVSHSFILVFLYLSSYSFLNSKTSGRIYLLTL